MEIGDAFISTTLNVVVQQGENELEAYLTEIYIINSSGPENLTWVMKMKYEDPNMEAYWNTLPTQVQSIINESGIEICSLGMLRKFGDYYQNRIGGESR